jgi:hypothetical protein
MQEGRMALELAKDDATFEVQCVCVWEGRERGRRKGREREEEREKAVGKESVGAGEERGMGRKGRAARGPQRQVLMSVTNA